MAYEKTIWTNGATALSAENMNHIENGIAALDEGKVDKENGKGLSSNDYTSEEKVKLTGIDTGAEVNQNAFSNVKVGSTTIAADSKTDTLELVAGSNVTLTPDATNDKVTIEATYSNATTSAAGLMSSSDKSKLDGIASGAQVNRTIQNVVTKLPADVTISANDTAFLQFGGSLTSYSYTSVESIHLTSTSMARAEVYIMGFDVNALGANVYVYNPLASSITLSSENSYVRVVGITMN